ncbi:MAG: preprotein translocase subunit YajC [Methylococcales bacterium]|nr:preprotein translocase subunit YajC [Methylococcales bacterium]
MSFFIAEAYAQAQPAAEQPGMEGLIFPLAILAFFYFLFLRPQNKRQKEHKQMLASLSKGAEVVTNGGVLGRVADLDDNFVKLEIGEGLFIQVQRQAIANLMPKGTYKAIAKKARD